MVSAFYSRSSFPLKTQSVISKSSENTLELEGHVFGREVEPHKGLRRTVLVVDDSPSIRHRLCEICSFHNFEVCAEAVNGADAIEKARQWQPELIILDLSMPVMSGLEAAPHLKNLLPHTPIILFTMFGETVSQTAALEAGITMVVSKSDSLEALIKKAQGLFQN